MVDDAAGEIEGAQASPTRRASLECRSTPERAWHLYATPERA